VKVADPQALAREVQRECGIWIRCAPSNTSAQSRHRHVPDLWRRTFARDRVPAGHGVHEYSWRRAFDRYAELRPELRADLDALKELPSVL